MSKQVQTELRTYMAYLDTQVEPIAIDKTTELGFDTELVLSVDVPPQSADLRPRRPWLVAATSAAAVLLLVGGVAWLAQATRSDTPVADTAVPATPSAAEAAAQAEKEAVSVFGQIEDHNYWEGPLCGAHPCVAEGRMAMSDDRLSGNATFAHWGELLFDAGAAPLRESYLYWGTLLIENDGGAWEGTHFAAVHHSQPEIQKPIVIQLVGSGGYAGLSAILYSTVVSPPGTALFDLEESVDGMMFPGNLPPDRP